MKKVILYLFLITLIMFSCSKEHKASNSPSPAKYKVTFNVSGFSEYKLQSIGKKNPSALRTDSVDSDTSSTDTLNVLYYMVYDSTGKIVDQITQQNIDPNFGTISDNLPAGTYTVTFAAGKTGLAYTVITPLSSAYFNYPDTLGWHDTFFKKMSLTVSGGAVTQNVVLPRVVAELEVDITDAIPANAQRIVVTIDDDLGRYYVNGTEYYNTQEAITSIIPAASVGETNYQVYGIVANTSTPLNIQISCYDSSNNLIGNGIANGVTFAENTRTILSGALFGSSANFQISLNDTWNPTPFVIDF